MTRATRGIIALLGVLLLMAGGCVHEFPDVNRHVNVRLKIRHSLGWTELDYPIVTKTGEEDADADKWQAHYQIHVYPKDDHSRLVYSYEFDREDLNLSEFETTIPLPPGEWDIYAWQDFDMGDAGSVSGTFYDSENFSAISCVKPYVGDTDRRDAFEGIISVEVPETIDAGYTVDAEMDMERPLAKYVFIATDFDKFYSETLTRNANRQPPTRWDALTGAQRSELLQGYSVIARYPLFMPAVYDMFTGRLRESWTGMSYTASIEPINEKEAIIAMDYVFINHAESGAQVALMLKLPNGEVLNLTNTIDVPTLRGRVTYVLGDFLTTSQSGGLDVDVTFSGDINIKI